jgi:hypothetical protein
MERMKAELIRHVEEANRKQLELLRAMLDERDERAANLLRLEVSRALAGRTNVAFEESTGAKALSDDIFSGHEEKTEGMTTKKRDLSRQVEPKGDYMDKVRNKILSARKKRRCHDLPDSA